MFRKLTDWSPRGESLTRWLCGLCAIMAVAAACRAASAPGFVTASSAISGEFVAENAVDGDLQTRWASEPPGDRPQWLGVDFGQSIAVDQLAIHWEAAYASIYEIQVSDDGVTWKTLVRKSDDKGGRQIFKGLRAQARHLRVVCLKLGPFGVYSIWELEFPEPHVAAALQSARRAFFEQRQRELAHLRQRLIESGAGEIVFAVRPVVGEHWYANFGYYAASSEKPYFGINRLYRDGTTLCRLNVVDGKTTALLQDATGGIRDPQLHYDAKKMVFAYRKGGTEHYHLYELNLDGTGLRQITDGPYDDIEPAYLPDGGIVFVSSRANRWVNCWTTQVATLHRCDADGRHIRPLSSNNEHDNTPWVLPDGRILYTRWEYVDRSQVDFHHLWTANPDGSAQTVFFGNQHPGTVLIDAKPIPGTDKVLASFSPGHGQTEHAGQIGIIDAQAGPDAQRFARVITRNAGFRDPWALSEDCFIAALDHSIVALDGNGQFLELFRLSPEDIRAGFLTHEPRPVMPRTRERLIPPRAQPSQLAGSFILANVYEGRNMQGVKPGEIKKLLVLETLPKPINFTGGMEPLSYGGTFTLERILGTVPVEPDGSAYFEVPALRSVFFAALDDRDFSVKRMQSFTSLMPGEVAGCVGCHEHRVKPPASTGQNHPHALKRGPSKIQNIPDVPDVLDFPRDIQPILNRHCLKCHDCDKAEAGVVLSGDRGPHYSLSYFTLTARSQVADGRNRPKSNYPPRALGSSGSPLMRKLEPSHHDVQLSALEKKIVRLWIDTGAPYPGTYAGLGCGMIGGYDQNTLDRTAEKWASTKAATETLRRRCGSCHTGPDSLPLSVCDEIVAPPWVDLAPNDPRRKYSRHLLYNLTRPSLSRLLAAPLAKGQGGLGLCRPKSQASTNAPAAPGVFANANDPDYVTILSAIREAAAKLDQIKRFDMPGFRPRPEWVREMKRYGILPADAPEGAAVDVYETERRYWESLWPKPHADFAGDNPPN